MSRLFPIEYKDLGEFEAKFESDFLAWIRDPGGIFFRKNWGKNILTHYIEILF